MKNQLLNVMEMKSSFLDSKPRFVILDEIDGIVNSGGDKGVVGNDINNRERREIESE